MEFLSNLLDLNSLKRAGVGALTAAIIALNKKLGLQLDATDVISLTGLAVAYITQSAVKEVKLAGIDAAAKVDSVQAAVDVLSAAPSGTTVNVGTKP